MIIIIINNTVCRFQLLCFDLLFSTSFHQTNIVLIMMGVTTVSTIMFAKLCPKPEPVLSCDNVYCVAQVGSKLSRLWVS